MHRRNSGGPCAKILEDSAVRRRSNGFCVLFINRGSPLSLLFRDPQEQGGCSQICAAPPVRSTILLLTDLFYGCVSVVF